MSYEYNTSWEKVRRVFPKGADFHILDIGCGDGRLVKHLTVDHEVYGLDADHEAVKKAYHAGIRAIKGSVLDPLPFPDKKFDVVLALDVLEHIDDISYALQEIRRVLTDDGVFIISLPNHFDLRTRLDILFGKGIIKWSQRKYEKNAWGYSHVRFMTVQEVRMMMHEHSLFPEIEQFNFMSGGLLPTSLTPSAIRHILVKMWPAAWSGKIIMRCSKKDNKKTETIIIDKTPKDF